MAKEDEGGTQHKVEGTRPKQQTALQQAERGEGERVGQRAVLQICEREEVEEDGGETIDEIYEEFEDIYETQEGFLLQFNQIIKLQARIKTLENTMEYLTRRPINSDGM